jgi:GMP synthase (glutamine-hydrolysing)
VRVLVAVHQDDAGPGVFAEAVRARGDELVEWHPPAGPPSQGGDALIVLGGAMDVHQEDEHPWLREEKRALGALLESGLPALGVCLGAELLAEVAGGRVVRLERPEIGWYDVELTPDATADPLLGTLPPRFSSFQWHSYASELPPGAPVLARNPACAQAYRLGDRAWGVQFHPEVTSEIVSDWLAADSDKEDAVEAGLDPDAVRERTSTEIAAWNELGRRLCGRFLELAAG